MSHGNGRIIIIKLTENIGNFHNKMVLAHQYLDKIISHLSTKLDNEEMEKEFQTYYIKNKISVLSRYDSDEGGNMLESILKKKEEKIFNLDDKTDIKKSETHKVKNGDKNIIKKTEENEKNNNNKKNEKDQKEKEKENKL